MLVSGRCSRQLRTLHHDRRLLRSRKHAARESLATNRAASFRYGLRVTASPTPQHPSFRVNVQRVTSEFLSPSFASMISSRALATTVGDLPGTSASQSREANTPLFDTRSNYRSNMPAEHAGSLALARWATSTPCAGEQGWVGHGSEGGVGRTRGDCLPLAFYAWYRYSRRERLAACWAPTCMRT